MTVTSETGTTTMTTPSDREVVITRVFEAPRELVFDAHTKPEHLRQWCFGPEGWTMPVCDVDLRPGGEWRFTWRKDDGTEMSMGGVYKDVTRPERIVNTESWGGDWPETLNTVVFTEEDGRTTLTLTIVYPSKEARDAAIATGMKDGVSVSYDRLASMLETRS